MVDHMEIPKDRFKILVASDIHLGYAEKDNVRGDDTFNTFEEVLSIAKEKQVDFVLLGGDLFHDNKPSAKSMTRCVEILRKYCLGDGEVNFSIISDQKVNFNHSQFPVVNYEDGNFNVALPVFSIHGNHDDPIGKDPLSVLDMLSATGLVNYFGKCTNMENITVNPLLIAKAKHKIALYGLGALPEERLHRFFLQDKVTFLEPLENSRDWFKILVVHQNRVAHGMKYLPEKFLGKLPDLVVWGHEHEAKEEAEYVPAQKFFIYQPGSTVITSLSPGEAVSKQVGLLEVFYDKNNDRNNFKITSIPLKSVRRLIFDHINLDAILLEKTKLLDETRRNKLIFETTLDKLEQMVAQAEMDHSGEAKEPREPLIRLRVQCSIETHPYNSASFGFKFIDRVANPKDLVLFKNKLTRQREETIEMDKETMEDLMEADTRVRCNIADVVDEYFKTADSQSQLTFLSEKLLCEAVKEMVEKDASHERLTQALDFQLKRATDELFSSNISDNTDNTLIEMLREHSKKVASDEVNAMNELQAVFKRNPGKKNAEGSDASDIDLDDDDFDQTDGDSLRAVPAKRGRGRGRARASAVRSGSKRKFGA